MTPVESPRAGWFAGVPSRRDPRWAFAALLTAFAVLGTLWLGFNRSPQQIAFTVLAGCLLDVGLHFVLRERRVLFPLSAYISSLSIALLLNYSHDWLPVLFPIFVTVGSKYLFTLDGKHFFNPSLTGVVVTLLLAGDLISSSPAYQWDTWRTITVFMAGAALTLWLFRVQRFHLVVTFLVSYAVLTLVRAWFTRHHIPPDVLFVGSITSPSFFLFSMFMMPDPKASPAKPSTQVAVAILVAVADLLFHMRQSLFTFFYAGLSVAAARFLWLHGLAAWRSGHPVKHVVTRLFSPEKLKTLAVLGGIAGVGAVGHAMLRPAAAHEEAGFTLEELPPARTGIELAMDGEIFRLVDERLLHIAKWVISVGASVAVADVDDDGMQDLLFISPAAKAGDRVALFLNRGGLRFERVPLPLEGLERDPRGHGYPSGALFFDVENDGDKDLLVLVSFGDTRLLRNTLVEEGRLAFVEHPAAGFDRSTISVAAAVADVDADGFPDVVIKNVAGTTLPGYDPPERLNIFDLPEPAHDGDRRMFFFIHNSWHKADNGGDTVVMKNRGDGTYAPVDGKSLGLAETHWTLAMSAADLDGDGFTDLYYANDFGPDDLYMNEGGKGFRRVEGRFFGEVGKDTYKGMNSTIADLSGDGRHDIYVSNAHVKMLAEGSLFWVQQPESRPGAPVFADEATERGLLNEKRFGWGAAAVDLDLDGLLDVVQGNGYLDDRFDKRFAPCPSYWYVNHKLMQAGPDVHTYADKWADLRGYCVFPDDLRRVYRNRGADAHPQFVDVAESARATQIEITRGIASVDLDSDGRMDLAISNQLGAPTLLHNVSAPSRAPAGFVGVDLRGDGVACAADAFGSVVTLEVPGLPVQVREKQPTSGLSAQSDPRLVFGLGSGAVGSHVDVKVRWCRGATKTYRVPVNAFTTVRP